MADPFAITEQPVAIPEAVATADVVATLTRLMVRCAALEQRLHDERSARVAALRELLGGLLEVCDALERMSRQAPDHDRQQRSLDMVVRLLRQRLSRAGVVAMNLVGMVPDPSIADIEASETHPDLPDETVVSHSTTGYLWNEEVLRRARVVVSRAQPPASETGV
jgi:molecular chaperone GrpE